MARDFDDASSEYLEVDSSPITGVPVTLSCWFYMDDKTADHTFVYTGESGENDHWFQLRFDESSDEFRYGVKDAGEETNINSLVTPVAATWTHIAGASASSTSHKIIVDGTKAAETTDARAPASLDRISIGRMGDVSPGKYMDGKIAEVALWDVELTDEEIDILAKGYSPLFVRPQNLVAYWPLIRDEDQDRVGGYDMTAYNTPTVSDHPPIIYQSQVHLSFASTGAPPASYPMPEALQSYRQRRT